MKGEVGPYSALWTRMLSVGKGEETCQGLSPTGYHVPGGLDTVLLFHSKFREDEWTKRFQHDLQDKLRLLEMEQHCKLQLNATSCFPSLNSHSDEFIVQVQLEGRAPGRNTTAESPGDNKGSGMQ